MRMGDHCGFYCAGLMVIGLACAGLPKGKSVAGQMQKAFTDSWKKSWPLRCREIKKLQGEKQLKDSCADVGKTAGKELGKLLEPHIKNPKRTRFARKTN